MKIDGRVRYTRMVIRDSFLKLLAEKPVQKITVKEICEQSGINRATFYTHYRDPFDLLQQIENGLFEDMIAALATEPRNPEYITREAFKVIENNASLCKLLFSENGDKLFLRRIMDTAREGMLADWHKQYPQASKQQLTFIYAFVIGGAVAVIEEWVKTGMKEIPLPLGNIAQKVMDMWVHP